MSGKKIYSGENYQFHRSEKHLGRGGNGAVYDVDIQVSHYPVVAKFFEYVGRDKEKRYDRFKKEIEIVRELCDCPGIMPVLDQKLPPKCPKRKDEAWYLMPKAEPYKVDRSKNFADKLDDMIQLANIIQFLHNKELAHRDIKPENILVLNGCIVLSDFGLVWASDEKRITKLDEKIGPYKILPPELERVEPERKIDYRKSDVYLFAKVLWMVIRENKNGFVGKYQRGDVQIDLNKDDYNVDTLRPIHQLIEESTDDDLNRRITIEKCIEQLNLQKDIISDDRQSRLPEELINKLKFEESSSKIIATRKPSQLVYDDKGTINDMLSAIIDCSKVYVENVNDRRKVEISASNVRLLSDGNWILTSFRYGKKTKEYLCNITKMTYFKQSESLEFELGEIVADKKEYIPFWKGKDLPTNQPLKMYFSSAERIRITKPVVP